MKVKNVGRVENNTENFTHTGLEKETAGGGASAQKGKMSSPNVADIVDINNPNTVPEPEGENPNAKIPTKNDAVFYNEKANITGKENFVKTATNGILSEETPDPNKELYTRSMQERMQHGKNVYARNSGNADNMLNSFGKEYISSKLTTFSDPMFNGDKNTFYSGNKATVAPNAIFNSGETVILGDGTGTGGNSIVNNGVNGSAIPEMSVPTVGNQVSADSLNDAMGRPILKNVQPSVAMDNNKSGGVKVGVSETIPKAETRISGLFMSRAVDVMADEKNGNSVSGNVQTQINEMGSGRVGDNANILDILNAKSDDETFNLKGTEVSKSEQSALTGNNLLNTQNEGKSGILGFLFGRKGKNDAEMEEPDVLHSLRDGIEGRDKPLKAQKEEDDRREIEIERVKSKAQEFMSAQAAYQSVINKSIADIYKVSPELDKLIALLFRLRKLTLKKIENNYTPIFERRSVEEEAELVLKEVKNLIDNEGYKKVKVLDVMERFLDEQEKIKACVGLSPFPIEMRDFREFYDGVKDEAEDIRDEVEKEFRKDVLKSIFRVIFLALAVVILYILFLR